MALSDSINSLMVKEAQKLRPNLMTPHPSRDYRDEVPKNRFELLPEDQAADVQKTWQDFHNENQNSYGSFDSFYYKYVFCREVTGTISEHNLKMLLADRTFLFPEYSDYAQGSEYPSIYQICRITSQSQINKWFDPAHVENILCEGIIPTKEHLQAYQQLQENLRCLDEALTRRRNNIRRFEAKSLSWKRDDNAPIFTVDLSETAVDRQVKDAESESTTNNEQTVIRCLSHLFYCYIEAMYTRGYGYRLKNYLNPQAEPSSWEEEIRRVYDFLLQNEPDWNPALVFFVLFTDHTKALAAHKLKKFDFMWKPPTQKAEQPVHEVQLTVSRRYECNIMLYDYLLDLLQPKALPEALSYAKYEFYALTHFQWYVHYHLPKDLYSGSGYHPNFHLSPDFMDGVDELGNLMRYDIDFCFPNGYVWLAIPPIDRHFNTVDPRTLLLNEVSLEKPSRRLITKIRRFLKQEEGKKLKQEYEKVAGDTAKVIRLLKECCQNQEFHFYYERLLYEYHLTKDFQLSIYGQLLLEHELREQLHEEARHHLREIVQKKFRSYFLTDSPFDV